MPIEDQDYKVITTPVKKQVVKIRNYITGADDEAINDILLNASTTVISADGTRDDKNKEIQKRETKIDNLVELKYVRLLLTRFVIDVDGVTTGAVDAIYAMRKEDYDVIVKELKELTKSIGGLDTTEKKT